MNITAEELRARCDRLEALLLEAFLPDEAGLYESEYDGRIYEFCQHCDYQDDVRREHRSDCLVIRAKAALAAIKAQETAE